MNRICMIFVCAFVKGNEDRLVCVCHYDNNNSNNDNIEKGRDTRILILVLIIDKNFNNDSIRVS